jgi:hypothetical protein
MNDTYLDEYLKMVTKKLEQRGYRISNNVEYKDQNYIRVAKRTSFELVKFGLVSTFFIFGRFNKPDIDTLWDFSNKSFKCANRMSGIHPPRSLFYGLIVFPMVIVDSIYERTAIFIRHKEPPKHGAATEKLVVFSLEAKTLYYCEGTFNWGSLYADWDRKIIKEMLSP